MCSMHIDMGTHQADTTSYITSLGCYSPVSSKTKGLLFKTPGH